MQSVKSLAFSHPEHRRIHPASIPGHRIRQTHHRSHHRIRPGCRSHPGHRRIHPVHHLLGIQTDHRLVSGDDVKQGQNSSIGRFTSKWKLTTSTGTLVSEVNSDLTTVQGLSILLIRTQQ
jgi:hypothetical protein